MRASIFSTKDSGHQTRGSPEASEVGVQGLEGKNCSGVTGGAVQGVVSCLKCESEVYMQYLGGQQKPWERARFSREHVEWEGGSSSKQPWPILLLRSQRLSRWFILSLSPFCSFCIPHLPSLN